MEQLQLTEPVQRAKQKPKRSGLKFTLVYSQLKALNDVRNRNSRPPRSNVYVYVYVYAENSNKHVALPILPITGTNLLALNCML